MRSRNAEPLLICAIGALILAGAASGKEGAAKPERPAAKPRSSAPGASFAPGAAGSGTVPAASAAKAIPPETGLGRLDAAWMLHPYARSAIAFLESIDSRKSWNPMYRSRPKEMLEAWDEMLRRNFKSVQRIERQDEGAPGRFHLVFTLDLHLKFGAVSGSTSRVTAQATIHRPDGTLVDQIQVVKEKTVPYPATDNMLFGAFLEALDGLEAGLAGSAPLTAVAQALP